MELVAILWLYAPAGVANMAPVLAKNIPLLKKFTQPLDAHKSFRGKRVFGSHKTVRGLLAAIIMGIIVVLLQILIFKLFSWPNTDITPINYDSLGSVWFGALLGFGAIAGDAIKSFFKRQVNIAPGQNWLIFDQIDYVVGAIVVTLPFFQLALYQYLFVVLVGVLLHPIINIVSWLLHLQDKPL